ncbi:ParB/RepB/Spo0J family partition protein [bacterium]|nr:ParB/RepB/Spo0J family partition protein [bacterium]
MKRKALGKGLGALIPERPAGPENRVQAVPLGQIIPGIQQPRVVFDNNRIKELADSIKTSGVIQPVVLRPVPTGYELVAGERRWRAARLAGLKHIPAIIRNMDDRQALEISLIENLQRHDLNPIEAARGYQLLMEQYDLKQEEVARIIGKNRVTIANTLRLLKLPSEIQKLVEQEKLSTGHAKAILGLKSETEMIRFTANTFRLDWSVRQLEREVQKHLSPAPTKPKSTIEDPNLNAVLDSLRKRYATQVKCVPKQSGGGKIILEYYNSDDLTRIIHLLGD